MKNIKKLGISALCGSLAAMSSAANAGEMEVIGTLHATWIALDSGSNDAGIVTGNPLGMKSNLSFKGSGELDGGQTFSVLLAHNDQNAWSSSNITLTTNNLGTLKLSAAEGGGGIGGYDDKMPNAFEEVWDSGVATGIDLAKGVGSSTNASWTSPKVLGGSNIQIAYASNNDGKQPKDKAGGGASGATNKMRGADVVIDLNPDLANMMPNLFVGASVTDIDSNTGRDNPMITLAGKGGEINTHPVHAEATAGLIFSFGPAKIGYQRTAEYVNAKGAGNADYYTGTAWGVSFNVNDDLSLSYGYFDSRKHYENPGANEAVLMEGTSIQVAYTLGGATIAFAETDVDNAVYNKNNDRSGRLVRLSLAF